MTSIIEINFQISWMGMGRWLPAPGFVIWNVQGSLTWIYFPLSCDCEFSLIIFNYFLYFKCSTCTCCFVRTPSFLLTNGYSMRMDTHCPLKEPFLPSNPFWDAFTKISRSILFLEFCYWISHNILSFLSKLP